MQIPFVGQAYTSKSLPFSAQTCVNWYLEAGTSGAKTPVALMPTPGLKLFCDLGTNKPVVSLHKMQDYTYAVSDGQLFSISKGGTVALIGDLSLGSDRVAMAHSSYQLIIVNETGGYTYNDDDGLEEITSDAFYGTKAVCFFDGYFVLTRPDTGEFYISSLYNGQKYDALDYATAEGAPDNLISIVNDHRELWLFGEETTEVWYNSGSSGFPFDRYSGAFIEQGCAAQHSPAKIDNTVFWLGDDHKIYRAVDYTPIRISTHAIETAINSYPAINDAFGFTYTQEGHSFYCLTFPTNGATWCYDAATGTWHERKSYGLSRHRANCYTYFADKHLVGDYSNGKIYSLDMGTYADDGEEIVRERTTQVLTNDEMKMVISRLQVLVESGVGLAMGETPKAMLQWSDDEGRTWSSERWVSIGKQGRYQTRALWRRLGSFRNRVFRLRISDPVKAVVMGATAKIKRGTS